MENPYELYWLAFVLTGDPNLSIDAVADSLDAGEAATISLALATQARLVLIDAHTARTAARRLGLTISGSLGVVIEAKRQQLISLVRPYLDQMMAQGRYISPQLRQQAVQLAGE